MKQVKCYLSFCLLFLSTIAIAQQNNGPAVGQWRSFFSYYQGTAVATDGTTFYCGTESGFFTYNNDDGVITAYSKVNGMHDVNITAVSYDNATGNTVIGYANSNIDIFKDGSFINIPDILLSTIIGDKSIRDISTANGKAYVSTGIGLVIIDLNRKESEATVQFFDGEVAAQNNCMAIIGNELYAATTVGVFKTNINNDFIQNYTSWQKLNDYNFRMLKSSDNNLYAADTVGLYVFQPDAPPNFIYANPNIAHLDPSKDGNIWLCLDTFTNVGSNKGLRINNTGAHTDSFLNTVHPRQICEAAGSVWCIQSYGNPGWAGLRKITSINSSESYTPSGPIINSAFDVWAKDGDIWLAHGAVNQGWTYKFNYGHFSHLDKNNNWTNYGDRVGTITVGISPSDCIRIIKDDQFTGNVYAAEFVSGLYELTPDDKLTNYSINYLENSSGDPGTYRLAGLALDNNGNLWMANFSGSKELKVKTLDGHWYGFHVASNTSRNAADIVIDDIGQKWYVAPGNGLAVYNDNGTLENASDDRSRLLRFGEGVGNLPDNSVMCVAKDKDGAIWCGTVNGIGVISCPEGVLENQCEADLPIVQYPGQINAGHLFQDQTVTAIAVDGGNRKWVGTNAGLWLVSDDAQTLIYHFTVDNSPLPSNDIYRISIDPVTGDVYVATANGLMSYRGDATEGTAENEKPLLIYPNPVPAGYTGQIAVRGLAENADVRFTDISGQLVYRTTANGGEAVWNGSDYTGHKVQSGVYLVFVVSKDGTQKATGKIFLNY